MSATAPALWTDDFSDPREMGAALRDGSIEYLSVARAGPYAARLTMTDFDGIRLLSAFDGPHLACGTIGPGRTVLLFPQGPVPDGLRLNGCIIGDHDAGLYRPGTELRAFAPGELGWSAIILDEQARSGLLDGHLLPQADGFTLLRDARVDISRLQSLTGEIVHLAQSDPARLGAGSVPGALLEQAAHLVARLTGAAAGQWRHHLLLRRRLRLAIQAEEFLRACIGQAVYTQDVAGALGVSERTLGDAFTAVYGMGVQSYLRIRRINLARQALLARNGHPTLVKTVALDLGFWNLGRFAQEYREHFGERPSETARRAPAAPGRHPDCGSP